jgi:hypothetical protein
MSEAYAEYEWLGGVEGMEEAEDFRATQEAEIWAEGAWLRAAEAPDAESDILERIAAQGGYDAR